MKSDVLFFAVLMAITCITQVGADIYAPSLPAITKGLHTELSLVERTMAIYMLGASLSQLIYGPLSEAIGRKTPILIGLGIMIGGSFMCLTANSLSVLMIGRLIQGCGVGACASGWRSIFRDKYKGEQLAVYGSYLNILFVFTIPFAPFIGGILQSSVGWRGSFWFMSIYGVVAFLLFSLFFTETHHHKHRDKLKPSYIKATFSKILKTRVFMATSLCTFLSYGAFFSWFTAGPFLMIEKAGLTPSDFGLISFIGGATACSIGGWINGKLVKRLGMTPMLRFGWAIMILSGVLMLLGYACVGIKAYGIAGPMILFYFGSTFIWPNTFATAFTPVGHMAGYAGALYGFLQIGGASVLGGLVSLLPSTTPIPLACIVMGASLLAWLVYEGMMRAERKGPRKPLS